MNDFSPETVNPEDIIVLEDYMAHEHDDDVILNENTIILAAGDVYKHLNMQIIMKALKDSGMSYQDVGDEGGVSKESVYKFLKKKSKSPSLYNFLMICKVLRVSIDEVCGIVKPKDSQCTPDSDLIKTINEMHSKMDKMADRVAEQNKIIETLVSEIRRTNNYDD